MVGERKYNNINTKETILLLQTASPSSQAMTEKKDKRSSLLQKTKLYTVVMNAFSWVNYGIEKFPGGALNPSKVACLRQNFFFTHNTLMRETGREFEKETERERIKENKRKEGGERERKREGERERKSGKEKEKGREREGERERRRRKEERGNEKEKGRERKGER